MHGLHVTRERTADLGWQVNVHGRYGLYDGTIYAPRVSVALDLASDGRINNDAYRMRFDSSGGATPISGPSAFAMIAPALVAFTIINSTNVTMVKGKSPRHERRREERSGNPPLVTFHTIEIGRVIHQLNDIGGMREVGRERALHKCRGHFADYRNGAGLFGKQNVLVFVPEHIRGNADRGVVISDYRVSAPR